VFISVTGKGPQLTSLDLSSAGTTSTIVGYQSAGWLLGQLTTTGGVASGGSVVVTPVNFNGNLSGFNIPTNVTLTAADFTGSNPISVTSVNPTVINGLMQYTTANSNGIITSTTKVQVGGSLTSTGSLTVTTPELSGAGSITATAGSVTVNGSAAGLLVSGSGNISAATPGAAVNLIASAGNLSFTSTKNITGDLNLSATAGSVSISNGVTLTGSGNIGITSPAVSNLGTINATGNITAQSSAGLNVTGNSGVLNAGGLTGISLSAGTGAMTATQNTFTGTVSSSGSSVTVSSLGTAGLVVGASSATAGNATFTVGGGDLAIGVGATITVLDGNLTLQNNDGANGTVTFRSGAFINMDASLAGGNDCQHRNAGPNCRSRPDIRMD
jgi:hypothetical protein